MDPKIRVIVAHKFLLLRKALVSLLENIDEIEITCELPFDSDCPEICNNCEADILITPILSADIMLFKKIEKIKKENKNLKILAITELSTARIYFNFYRAGINGTINPNCSRYNLLKAIHLTQSQDKFVQVTNDAAQVFDLREKIFSEFNHKICEKDIQLTRREKEVLHLISEGLTTKEISDELHLSRRTIDHFRQMLIQKLRVKSAAGLIRSAILLNSNIA